MKMAADIKRLDAKSKKSSPSKRQKIKIDLRANQDFMSTVIESNIHSMDPRRFVSSGNDHWAASGPQPVMGSQRFVDNYSRERTEDSLINALDNSFGEDKKGFLGLQNDELAYANSAPSNFGNAPAPVGSGAPSVHFSTPGGMPMSGQPLSSVNANASSSGGNRAVSLVSVPVDSKIQSGASGQTDQNSSMGSQGMKKPVKGKERFLQDTEM
jgi:hypothetical protein